MLALTLVVASPAYALVDKDVYFQQWDQGNTTFWPRFLGPLGGGVSSVYVMNGNTEMPDQFTWGTGLVANTTSKTIDVLNVPTSSIDGLSILLATKADVSHTHVISDVTGLQTALNAKANSSSLATVATTGDYNDLINKPSSSWTFATSSRSLTTGTGATGFQVSATRNATVSYAVNIATVATLGAPSAGYITMEIAPTNSSNAADWFEVGTRCRADNTVGLLAVQSTQGNGCSLSAPIPAGYYVKLRSVTVSGTPTFTLVSTWETKQQP